MTLIIPIAMIAVLIVLLIEPQSGNLVSPARTRTGYTVMTLLAVYGGFLSGGYATLVTVAGIVFFRYPLLRGIAMARMLNTASSMIAVAVFAWYGHYRLATRDDSERGRLCRRIIGIALGTEDACNVAAALVVSAGGSSAGAQVAGV